MRLESEYSVASACKTVREVARLSALLDPGIRAGGLRVEWHQNACTMASLSRRRGVSTLRMHWLFTRASSDVLAALARLFFSSEEGGSAREQRSVVLDFIEKHRRLTLSAAGARQLRSPRGRVYDLEEIEERVRSECSLTCPAVRIGWSGRVTPCLMGKWVQMPAGSPNLVMINPLLDDARVPRFYVEYVVFHELLHEIIPIRRRGGRWVHHPTEFRSLERRFPAYKKAQRWELQSIAGLFRSHVGASRSGASPRIQA